MLAGYLDVCPELVQLGVSHRAGQINAFTQLCSLLLSLTQQFRYKYNNNSSNGKTMVNFVSLYFIYFFYILRFILFDLSHWFWFST